MKFIIWVRLKKFSQAESSFGWGWRNNEKMECFFLAYALDGILKAYFDVLMENLKLNNFFYLNQLIF